MIGKVKKMNLNEVLALISDLEGHNGEDVKISKGKNLMVQHEPKDVNFQARWTRQCIHLCYIVNGDKIIVCQCR